VLGPFAALRMLLAVMALAIASPARAEDGHDLWLRYPRAAAAQAAPYRTANTQLVLQGHSPTLDVAAAELVRGLSGMTGAPPPRASAPSRSGAVLLGTPSSSPIIAGLSLPLQAVGPEGFVVRSASLHGRRVTVIAANSDIGVLYGVFRYLREMQTGRPLAALDILEAPKVKLRVLDHWDNLDRTVERGYAGQSLWDWWKLPGYRDPRYVDYARANASVGVNGAVLNNVNAKPESLTAPYLAKAAALADVFRPYGIKVYLSARFSAPNTAPVE